MIDEFTGRTLGAFGTLGAFVTLVTWALVLMISRGIGMIANFWS